MQEPMDSRHWVPFSGKGERRITGADQVKNWELVEGTMCVRGFRTVFLAGYVPLHAGKR